MSTFYKPDTAVVLGVRSEQNRKSSPLKTHILVGRNRQQTYRNNSITDVLLKLQKNKTGNWVRVVRVGGWAGNVSLRSGVSLKVRD